MRALETRYARALFQVVRDEASLSRDVELLTGSAPLWSALENPGVSRREKDRVICRVFQGNTSQKLLNFYRLLLQRERLSLLPAILRQYHLLCLQAEGGVRVVYRCARAPFSEDLERIGAMLKRRHGFSKVEFVVEQDPALMGGFLLQVGDITYDKSVRTMLRNLRRSLKVRE